jgi:hypothetical protein
MPRRKTQRKRILKRKTRVYRGGVKGKVPEFSNEALHGISRELRKLNAKEAKPLLNLKHPLLPNPPSRAQTNLENAAQSLLGMKYSQ